MAYKEASLEYYQTLAIVIPMFTLSRQQRYWLDFLFAMTEKEIKARYKFAVLGFLWIVLNPFLQMLVIGVVFQFFMAAPIQHYFQYLLAGLLPWNFFSYSLTKTTPAIVYERGLIQKAAFPRETIILSIIFANFFHLCIALILFAVFSISVQTVSLFSFILLLPALVWLLILTTGVCLLTSALQVKYRDVNFFITALLPLLFYVSPIVYSSDMLPVAVRMLLKLNPLSGILELFHYIFVGTMNFSIHEVVLGFGFSVLFCFISWKFFQRESKYFDDWF